MMRTVAVSAVVVRRAKVKNFLAQMLSRRKPRHSKYHRYNQEILYGTHHHQENYNPERKTMPVGICGAPINIKITIRSYIIRIIIIIASARRARRNPPNTH